MTGQVEIDNKPIQLQYDDKDRRVVVTPEDQDRFSITVQEAIESCRMQAHSFRFGKQFETLLDLLYSWAVQRAEKLQRACITVHDGHFLFIVSTKGAEYDSALEDELSDLDILIARDENLDLIKLNVLAIPFVSESAACSFIAKNPLEFPIHAK